MRTVVAYPQATLQVLPLFVRLASRTSPLAVRSYIGYTQSGLQMERRLLYKVNRESLQWGPSLNQLTSIIFQHKLLR
jgi:hypothetical protein